jgi:hypothetical protein
LRQATVNFGGTAHTITELRSKANADWRKQYAEALAAVRPQMEKLNQSFEVENVVPELEGMLSVSTEAARDLLKAYAPELPWEEIEETAYDSDYADALREVAALAFPFDAMTALLRAIGGAGLTTPTT